MTKRLLEIDDERVRRHIVRLRGRGALDISRIEEARRVTHQPTEWVAPAGTLDH